MRRPGARRRRSVATGSALVGLAAGVLTGSVQGAQAAEAQRLAGASRYGTAVAISRHGFANGADTVYLARADAFADALAAGPLENGPVLLVPSDGLVPTAVADEVTRLDPATVIALGGQAAVSQRTLDVLAAGRSAQRLEGASRYQTAVAISRAAFPSGADIVFLARGDGYADALAAGALSGGPILLVPSDGQVPSEVAAEVQRLSPSTVVALGGPAAVPQGTLTALAAGRTAQRLAGDTRYQTATAITAYGFPSGAGTVYVARGDGFADALAAGSLDAPVLLVPSSGPVPAEVLAEAQRLAPSEVIALGGEPAVPQSTLLAVAAAATGVPPISPTDPVPPGPPVPPELPSPGAPPPPPPAG